MLETPKFHYYFHKMSRLDHIINQLNAYHNFTNLFSNISDISSSLLSPSLPSGVHYSEEKNPYN